MSVTINITKDNIPQVVTLELKARKSLDGNIMIFDHEDMDIIVMPQKSKIVTFARDDFSDSVYEAQNRMFNFLKRRGVVDYETIRGGSVYGSLEASIQTALDENMNNVDYAIYGIYKFLKEEKPYYDYINDYEEMLDDSLTEPTDEDSTELGEVPQSTEKGSIRPGYNHDPYWMSYMLEGKETGKKE